MSPDKSVQKIRLLAHVNVRPNRSIPILRGQLSDKTSQKDIGHHAQRQRTGMNHDRRVLFVHLGAEPQKPDGHPERSEKSHVIVGILMKQQDQGGQKKADGSQTIKERRLSKDQHKTYQGQKIKELHGCLVSKEERKEIIENGKVFEFPINIRYEEIRFEIPAHEPKRDDRMKDRSMA